MITKTPSRRLSELAAALLLICSVTAAQEMDTATYGDEYQSGDFGRVRYQENGVIITRAELESGGRAGEEAGLNAPIFPGDEIETGSSQRVEVQLSSGSLVRLDRGSKLVFLALPDPYAELADHTVLQLALGALRLDAVVGNEEEFRIDTPACTIYLTGDADLRIEVDERGRTVVFARRGVTEVVGEGGSVLVHSGMTTAVELGELPYDAEPFNTFLNDGFDRWVEDRDAIFRVQDRHAGDPQIYEDLPQEVRPYYVELSGHGSWVDTDDYGYVWYPSHVGSDWRPYYDGYWEYGPHGYFWVSNEPWGWAPYHYGRWTWLGGRGWCWVPGHLFAGAWVSWSWGSSYVGWSALDYWGLPVYRSSLHFGYYDPFAWTFVGYGHFNSRYCARYRVPFESVGNIEHHAIVTRPPRVAPGTLASSVEARAQAVRELHENRSNHRLPANATRAGRPSFRDLENQVARGGGRGGSRVVQSPGQAAGSRTRAAETRMPATLDRRGTTDRPTSAAGTVQPRYPRTRTPERGASPGARGELSRRLSTTDPKARPDRSPAQSPGSSAEGANDPARTTDRVRSIYRKMSAPRETRPRPKEPEQSADQPKPVEGTRPQKAPPKKSTSRGSDDQVRNAPQVSTPPRVHSQGGIVRSSPRVAASRPSPSASAPRSTTSRSREALPQQARTPDRSAAVPRSAPRPGAVPRATIPQAPTRRPSVGSVPRTASQRPAPAPAPRAASPSAPREQPAPAAAAPRASGSKGSPGGSTPSARSSGHSPQPRSAPQRSGGSTRGRGRG